MVKVMRLNLIAFESDIISIFSKCRLRNSTFIHDIRLRCYLPYAL
jgi:hypothetical protein